MMSVKDRIFRFLAISTHGYEAYILAGFGVANISAVKYVAFRMR